jgi:D-alanyl-D-alanine carboxypeptidase
MHKLSNKQAFSLGFTVFLILFLISIFVGIKSQKVNRMTDQEKVIERNYLMGKFEPNERADFTLIPTKYETYAGVMYLRNETLAAFIEMSAAAKADGISLKIASATRNFDYQKNIWNSKWSGATLVDGNNLSMTIPDSLTRFKKILEYSSVPGASRHHWGTDIDINESTTDYFNGVLGTTEYIWLVKNAQTFGFCQPYNLKNGARPEGYNEERWHWSYLPLAKTFTQEYKSLITENDIKGFLGDQFVAGEDIINEQVLGINSDCL